MKSSEMFFHIPNTFKFFPIKYTSELRKSFAQNNAVPLDTSVFLQVTLAASGAHCAVLENILTPPTECLLFSSAHPLRNSSLASYFASKLLASKSPSPYEFPMTFHGVGMDFLWN